MMDFIVRSELSSFQSARTMTVFAITLLTFLTGGCANTEYQEPTHRWVSTNATSAQYRVDNNYCRKVLGDRSQGALEVSTPEYEQYTACMHARGYTLTAYNDSAQPVR